VARPLQPAPTQVGRPLVESHVEDATLDWFRALGYATLFGPDIAPDGARPERTSYGQPLLLGRLEAALGRLNAKSSRQAVDAALTKLQNLGQATLLGNNRAFHGHLVNGITAEVRRPDGRVTGERLVLVDFDHPDQNDWLVVNQYTMVEGRINRRPDIVVFVNGLPLAVLEIKNPLEEGATVWSAFNQLQTYKDQIPSLFHYNEALVISDGMEALVGSISSNKERFMPWRTIAGEELAPATMLRLEVLVQGVFEKRRFLDLIRHFVVFEDDGAEVLKKTAGYHQFHAVNRALESTRQAAGAKGDRKAGVVWHTQGSGKSLTMVFYAGRVILDPAFQNPTIVVLTDRNDLDDQLFGTFSRCRELLREAPVQAGSRGELREHLKRASGGIVFTTIQKFFPEEKGDKHPLLTDRRNVIVIADEAHRSQYDFIDGFARHMRDALPNASFIGFTGTPIELQDKNTKAIFGDYVSIYDIQRAVEDKATVPIYYESRLAKMELDESMRPKLDSKFEEVTEGEEEESKRQLKTKWAALEAVVGTEKRLRVIAKDLVKHFETRLAAMDGKAMVVCMSRRIAVDLYAQIVKLRPAWDSKDDAKGAIKVVMTGSASDMPEWQRHIRNKPGREFIAKRFKDPKDPLKIVIVRDMWLTGFDAPCLHTMYVDKPMRGHGLMQAIARVNRVFQDKPGGLVVDYLGLAEQLRAALATYTESGGQGKTAIPEEEAVRAMMEKFEVCRDLFHGFNYADWKTGTPAQRLNLLPAAQEHVLAQENGKPVLLQAVTQLSRAFALAATTDEAEEIREDVGFFQAVRTALAKNTANGQRDPELLDHAVRQLVSQAVASEKVVDVFAAAGLKKPDISILSDAFLAEVRGMPQKNLAIELLRKLLTQEIKVRLRQNVVESRSFSELLERSIRKYQNRAIETAQVIEELIGLAKDIREAETKGQKLGLTPAEVAFYDALGVNDSAVQVLGDEALKAIAREVAEAIRANVTIDWTVKETVRANLRVLVKRILRKHGYPPDKQESAVQTVLEQAEVVAGDWAEQLDM
jgi:type I restriction enzyme, R subunit